MESPVILATLKDDQLAIFFSVEYDPDMSEEDPRALFQQMVPQTFLTLQEKVGEKVQELRAEGKPPVMEEATFHAAFIDLFEDKDELTEAVYFLNLQGTFFRFNGLWSWW